jgi:exodeoxyribonuclease VII small subunit
MAKELTFEESMEKLEEIANELEKNDLSLDESIKKFEEGMKISKHCKDIIDKAEKKITILVDGKEDDFKIEQEN